MSVSSVISSQMVSRFTDMRTSLSDLQRQLSTGQKAETYGGLGTERSQSVSFRQKIGDLDALTASTEQVNLRVKLLDTAMTRLDALPNDVRASLDPNNYSLRLDGKTDAQKTATIALDEVVGLLNSQADGRYLMSGKTTDTRPVASVDEIINGTGTKAGLKQVIAERLTADLGVGTADGVSLGRLTVTGGATTTVGREIEEPDEFGYKIAGITSSSATSSITTSSDVQTLADGKDHIVTASAVFGDNVVAGDQVTLSLTNPDGTPSTITLTATNSATASDGSFSIGASGDETGTNFAAALQAAIATKVKTEFQSASAMRAADTYFGTYGGELPARVDTASSGDLATATSLTRDTEDTTVQWYRGYNEAVDETDPSTSPRNDIIAQVDQSVSIGYGVRANEAGFAKMVQSLAVLSVASFDSSVSTDENRYAALAERTRDTLAFDAGEQGPADIHAEVAAVGKVSTDAATRHAADKSTLQELLDGVEGVNKEDVAAQIMTLQNRMEASYQSATILWGLSLTKYM
jgi:hypothetical protein